MYQIEKIVLSSDRQSCIVYLIDGPNMNFTFSDLGMNYIEGLKWIQFYLESEERVA